MATVFLGTSQFAAAILERLARSEAHRPALVVTRPDRPRGRGRRATAPPVADRARELGLALAQPQRVNDPDARALIAQAGRSDEGSVGRGSGGDADPQTIVVCAFGALIKEPLLSEHSILNVHPSLLPRWRGAAPVERAIMAGDQETGVSIMRLTAGLDSGPVCLAAGEPIRPDDTYGSLTTRLQELGGQLILRALDDAPPFIDQPADGVTYAEKISPADRLLDPSRPAAELERVVRALHPHVRAQVELPDGTLLGVHRAGLADDVSPRAELGLRVSGERLLLVCREGTLELLVVQPPGGRPMDAAAYLRGHELPGRR
ncbi:MAG TPA: methionyl-tRNA formyltransferase [Solirubrobacteraceae bacterium]|nr:methionyl-tRNA formyltransferase [Solirubrobacteraceae bacterium]